MSTYKNGFTIVELLIVIVIIAILASISAVAYSGIRERAVNSQVSGSVHDLETSLQIHRGQRAGLPATPAQAWSGSPADGTMVCLGYKDKYCALRLNNDGSEQTSAGNINGVTREKISQDYATLINTSTNSLPDTTHSPIDVQTGYESNPSNTPITFRIRGLLYGYNLTGSTAYRGVFMYYALYGTKCLEGDEKAGLQYGYPASQNYNDWFPVGNKSVFCRKKLANALGE